MDRSGCCPPPDTRLRVDRNEGISASAYGRLPVYAAAPRDRAGTGVSLEQGNRRATSRVDKTHCGPEKTLAGAPPSGRTRPYPIPVEAPGSVPGQGLA